MNVSGASLSGSAVMSPHQGSVSGWPLVLYFHHVHQEIRHYTSLLPSQFELALDLLSQRFEMLSPVEYFLGTGIRSSATTTALITIDDCYRDAYDWALPALESRGLKAVFFAITDRVAAASGRNGPPEETFMSWPQLREVMELGHLVGSHTASHAPLRGRTEAEVHREVTLADQVLLEELGISRPLLAYPFGSVPRDPGSHRVLRDRLCFGTVRSSARPWDLAPLAVRRTYLPFDDCQTWPRLVEGWASPC
jgi:peptidoglycan/xylan/chitin deacetylase (PgdA/CDA1 family)